MCYKFHTGSEFSTQLPDSTSATQSCLTLQPRGRGRPPGFSVHGILQARILELGDISQIQVLLTSKWTYPSISWPVPIRDSTDTPKSHNSSKIKLNAAFTHTYTPASITHTHTPMSLTGGQRHTHTYVSHWRSESHRLPPSPESSCPKLLPSPSSFLNPEDLSQSTLGWGVFHLTQPPKCLYS